MQIIQPTTPFGLRPLSLAMVSAQATAEACPPNRAAHKWQVFRDVCECKDRLGVTERSLTVLNALLTFHPQTALTPGGDHELVVYPSNEQLALRAHGMPATTLRRHLATLVNAGLIVRRDSPNGKRFVRRNRAGGLDAAYGFDLLPLVARSLEFERGAEEVRVARSAFSAKKEVLTLLRRDVAKMIAVGIEEGVAGDWVAHEKARADVLHALPRNPVSDDLEAAVGGLMKIASELRSVLQNHVKSSEMNANESHNGGHIQNSKPDPILEEKADYRLVPGGGISPSARPIERPSGGFPLSLILDTCPDIVDYAQNGIRSWADLVRTAEVVRSVLGVSPSAWLEAKQAMSEIDAAITIAAILQRAERINSPGGYLRNLAEKARAGQFSIGPVVFALMREGGSGRTANCLGAGQSSRPNTTFLVAAGRAQHAMSEPGRLVSTPPRRKSGSQGEEA
jgi:replication initiation protein RepC